MQHLRLCRNPFIGKDVSLLLLESGRCLHYLSSVFILFKLLLTVLFCFSHYILRVPAGKASALLTDLSEMQPGSFGHYQCLKDIHL